MFEARKQLVLEKIEALRSKVRETFGIDMPAIHVSFDLRGARLANASRRNGQLFMNFNPLVIKDDKGWEHISTNTIPHEMAHLVCYVAPHYGRNHDNGWKRVCRLLGGNGQSRAPLNMDLRTRKERQYAYIATCKTVVTVTQTRHNRILKGASYTLRQTGGKLTKDCQYKQVA
jgi:predicted SprT family Zn-dependent metalloprotease